MRSDLFLSVSVEPDKTRIDMLREAVARIAAASLGGAQAEALSMVASELLDNAAKYRRPLAGPVTLGLEQRGGHVVISVGNAVEDGSEHVAALRDQIAWLQGFADPSEAYLAALKRVFDGAGTGVGRLGLARIAYEGGAALSHEIERPGWLVVRAARPVDEPAIA